LGKFILKITNFGDFGERPHYKSDNGEIWREARDLGHPPPPLIYKKIAQADLSYGGNFYQLFEILAIFSYLSPYSYTNNVKILLKRKEDLGMHQ